VAPILFGIDKFATVMTDWTKYLASEYNDLIPGTASQAMHMVGVVEIAAGLLVAVRPRIGAYVVAAWLAGIILDLLLVAATGTSRCATSACCSERLCSVGSQPPSTPAERHIGRR
jgi:hypothetical protein